MLFKYIVIEEGNSIICEEYVDLVANGDQYYVNNAWDTNEFKVTPKKKEDIVSKAKQRAFEDVVYDLFNYNCEHFVTEMRYGRAFSKQV